MTSSKLEKEFAILVEKEMGDLLPLMRRQYRPFVIRRWTIDFAFPSQKIAVEIDGGLFVKGRHARGAGIQADDYKLNCLAADGWLVLRLTPQMLRNGAAVGMLKTIFRKKELITLLEDVKRIQLEKRKRGRRQGKPKERGRASKTNHQKGKAAKRTEPDSAASDHRPGQ